MDAALGRVALVLRLIGAVWMVLLAVVYGLGGRLTSPRATAVVTAVGVAWALAVWRAGWIDRGPGSPRLTMAADLAVTCVVILAPGLLGEERVFSGGYPFAALVVGLAAAGRRGVVLTATVLSVATLASLGAGGFGGLPVVVGNLLLYVLGAVAVTMGIEVIRANERRARRAEAALAIAEERAATATHLHDSVLQTLALVQRRAEDAGAVRSLVRRQERELRDWLFPQPTVDPEAGASGEAGMAGEPAGPVDPAGADRRMRGLDGNIVHNLRMPGSGPGSGEGTGAAVTLLGPALERHAEEVEERYGVAVAVVMVGGAARLALPEDEREGLCAVVMAAREAMINAAVHAGVDTVNVYAETDAAGVAVFVRDRGQGFDLDSVAPDRQGVRGSIIQRMQRTGGSATIRATPGRGTEVQLRLPHDRIIAGDAPSRPSGRPQ